MRSLRVIFLSFSLIFLCGCQNSLSTETGGFLPEVEFQDSANSGILAELRDMGAAFGMWQGFEYWCDRIMKEYPDMTIEVKRTLLELDMAFGKGISRIEEDLKSVLGDEYNTIKETVKNNLIKEGKTLTLSKQDYHAYLEDLSSYADGTLQLPSPVFETLLIYQYNDDPIAEFQKGYVQKISSKNHTKSKGLNIEYKVPISWKTTEGDRPHIVSKQQSRMGLGKAVSTLYIRDMYKEELEYMESTNYASFFSREWAEDFISEGSTLISYHDFAIDGIPTAKVVYDNIQQIGGQSLNGRYATYVFFYDGRLVMLNCVCGSENDSEIDARFATMKPLFDAIAGSIVLQNQWNK